MASVTSVQSSSATGFEPESTLSSKVLHVAKIIAQIAVRIIFIIGSVVVTAAALPVEFYAIGLPIAALVSAAVSSLFFQEPAPQPLTPPLEEPDASHEVPLDIPHSAAIPSKHTPRGLDNLSNNCAFNSLVHLLESDPAMAALLRAPMTKEEVVKAVKREVENYEDAVLAAQKIQELDDYLKGTPLDGSKKKPYLVERYENTLAILDALRSFFTKYDAAIANDQRLVFGSQELREAVSKVNSQINPSARVQEDAAECLNPLLDFLPQFTPAEVKVTHHFDLSPFDAINRPDNATSVKNESYKMFQLSLKQGDDQPLHLQQMLDYACDCPELDEKKLKFTGKDGVVKECLANRTVLGFEEAPVQGLYLQLKRFEHKGQAQKNDAPVIIPPTLTISVKGTPKTYQLASFVHHGGSTPKSGHYIAGRIINGERYWISDSDVIPVDHSGEQWTQRWERHLAQAYLLCYVPQSPSLDQSSAMPPV